MPILVIVHDDERRTSLSQGLIDRGRHVSAVPSPERARAYLRAFVPALIVHEVPTDDDGARTFLAELHTMEAVRRCPVIAIVGDEVAHTAAEACGFLSIHHDRGVAAVVELASSIAPRSTVLRSVAPR